MELGDAEKKRNGRCDVPSGWSLMRQKPAQLDDRFQLVTGAVATASAVAKLDMTAGCLVI